jgi:hypothetical protein
VRPTIPSAGRERERQEDRDRPREVVERVLDLFLVALEPCGLRLLLGDDAIECLLVSDLRAPRGGEQRPGEDRPKLDELSGRDTLSAKLYVLCVRGDVTPDGDRMAPDAIARPACGLGEEEDRRQLAELLLPFFAPDLQVDVDNVLIRDCEPTQTVPDGEGTDVRESPVVPDDPHAVGEPGHPKRVGGHRSTRARQKPLGSRFGRVP